MPFGRLPGKNRKHERCSRQVVKTLGEQTEAAGVVTRAERVLPRLADGGRLTVTSPRRSSEVCSALSAEKRLSTFPPLAKGRALWPLRSVWLAGRRPHSSAGSWRPPHPDAGPCGSGGSSGHGSFRAVMEVAPGGLNNRDLFSLSEAKKPRAAVLATSPEGSMPLLAPGTAGDPWRWPRHSHPPPSLVATSPPVSPPL